MCIGHTWGDKGCRAGAKMTWLLPQCRPHGVDEGLGRQWAEQERGIHLIRDSIWAGDNAEGVAVEGGGGGAGAVRPQPHLQFLGGGAGGCEIQMVVFSNTSADQYRRDGMEYFKHCSVMLESIEDMSIQPETYVIIDDIRAMGQKHGSQRECLSKFFTMYSHHYKLKKYFFSLRVFDNIKDMRINTNLLYNPVPALFYQKSQHQTLS